MLPVDESFARFAGFIGVLALMASLEFALPRRRALHSKVQRWVTNFTVVGLGVAVIRGLALLTSLLAVPLVAISAAEFASSRGWGLFNSTEWPPWLELALAVIVLDFAIWGQHVASHKVPVLWRLHRVHHADVDFDVTTALRFHPIEIGLSMLYKVVWVLALGASTLAVFVFEVLLNACAMFNHSNVKLPLALDRVVRALIVTPDMHRVHHSIIRREHDSNYGFSLSIWDRLFGTYTDQPVLGHEGMTIGLVEYQGPQPTRIWWSLALPFVKTRPVGALDKGRR